MTILPKKKERNSQKSTQSTNASGGVGVGVVVTGDGHVEDPHSSLNHRHNYHHNSSPPRWGTLASRGNDRVSNNTESSCAIDIVVGSDPNKRSSSDVADVSILNSLDSGGGPSHGSKRRQRDSRYPMYSATRSKSKANQINSASNATVNSGGIGGNNALSMGGAMASDGLDTRPGTSGVSVGPSTRTSDVLKKKESKADDENVDGYNSGDEHGESKMSDWTQEELDEMDRIFEVKMRKKGLIIKNMGEDGACLFRAVADQVYGDQEMHGAVRKLCMDYMAKNVDYFSQYVTEDFDEYLRRKRCEHSHGNHIEIQALSEMFNRPIEVYHYNTDPINIFQGCQQADNEPIRLSYHRNIHYNSIVDPYKATIGVGLGLPSFKPGSAEANLMEKAIRVSEEHELEKAMLEDKLRATDWEATNEAIEEQVARESYLDWLRENEQRAMKNKKSKLSASATATATATDNQQQSPSRNSPKASSSGACSMQASYGPNSNRDFKVIETASFVNQLSPHILGISDLETPEEGDILARVLAQSQQEYLDSLKKRNATNSSGGSNSSNSSSCTSSGSDSASQSTASCVEYSCIEAQPTSCENS